jgi:hypothetical protein
MGNGVALGAGVVVGADTGAQADNIRLTSKNTINVRFILRVLLWRSSRPTACASPAPRSAAERRQVQARWLTDKFNIDTRYSGLTNASYNI